MQQELEKPAEDGQSGGTVRVPELERKSADYEWLAFYICDDFARRVKVEWKKEKLGCICAVVVSGNLDILMNADSPRFSLAIAATSRKIARR